MSTGHLCSLFENSLSVRAVSAFSGGGECAIKHLFSPDRAPVTGQRVFFGLIYRAPVRGDMEDSKTVATPRMHPA